LVNVEVGDCSDRDLESVGERLVEGGLDSELREMARRVERDEVHEDCSRL